HARREQQLRPANGRDRGGAGRPRRPSLPGAVPRRRGDGALSGARDRGGVPVLRGVTRARGGGDGSAVTPSSCAYRAQPTVSTSFPVVRPRSPISCACAACASGKVSAVVGRSAP